MTANTGESIETCVATRPSDQRSDRLGTLSIREMTAEELLGGSTLATAARSLRARVYIEQHGFLPASAMDKDGGEHDDDDARSMHFLALRENPQGDTSVIGTMRLISKRHDSRSLPVESFYPEYFEEHPIPDSGFEVSRLVAERQREVAIGKLASFGLIQAGLAYALKKNWSPSYAVVEPPLERRLHAMGVQTRRVDSPKWIDWYNSENVAIEIDLQKTREVMVAGRGDI